MSATNENELAAVSSTELAVLPPSERAALIMGSAKLRAELTALADSTKDIVAVIDKAGRKQVHSAAMVLVKRKTGIKDAGEEAREDANKFSKAVIAEQKALTSIIEPEETRLLGLRDAFDAEEEAREKAKVAAQLAHAALIADRIAALLEDETDAIRIDKTADQTRATLEFSLARSVTPELFEDRFDEAVKIHADVVASIRAILVQREADEAAAAKVEADRQAELKAIAEQKAEQARIAAEQAATAKALADEKAKMQKERDDAAATARAAQLEAERLAKAEADKVAAQRAKEAQELADERAALAQEQAEFKRKQDEAAAKVKLAAEIDIAHGEAITEDVQRAADYAAACAAKQAMVDDAITAGHDQAADEHAAGLPAGALGADSMADMEITEGPDDEDMIKMIAANWYPLDRRAAIERMRTIDFDAALAALAEAA